MSTSKRFPERSPANSMHDVLLSAVSSPRNCETHSRFDATLAHAVGRILIHGRCAASKSQSHRKATETSVSVSVMARDESNLREPASRRCLLSLHCQSVRRTLMPASSSSPTTLGERGTTVSTTRRNVHELHDGRKFSQNYRTLLLTLSKQIGVLSPLFSITKHHPSIIVLSISDQ